MIKHAITGLTAAAAAAMVLAPAAAAEPGLNDEPAPVAAESAQLQASTFSKQWQAYLDAGGAVRTMDCTITVGNPAHEDTGVVAGGGSIQCAYPKDGDGEANGFFWENVRLTTVLERQGQDYPVAYMGTEEDIHNGAIDFLPAPEARADVNAPGMYRTRIYVGVESYVRWGAMFNDQESTSVESPWVFIA